jgi:hypothetical protein
LDEVLVDGLKTYTLLQCWGAVFRHVTLCGRIGRIMISPVVAAAATLPSQQEAFDRANAEFYDRVDWALDVSEAEFEEGEIQGIPARLIRRDPDTQFVVTRENALRADWQHIDLSGTHWTTSLQFFVEGRDSDVVLVAPKRHRNFKKLLAGRQALRAAGIASAD